MKYTINNLAPAIDPEAFAYVDRGTSQDVNMQMRREWSREEAGRVLALLRRVNEAEK